MKSFLLTLFLIIAFTGLLSGQTDKQSDKLPPDLKKQFSDSLKLKITPDTKNQFPGSSQFYKKWPPVKQYYSYEKSFIVKPDTSVKYFLMIKDPLTHKVSKY